MPSQQAPRGSVPIVEQRAIWIGLRLAAIAIAVPLMLAGCLPSLSDLNPLNLIAGNDEEDEDRLQGERISVLSLEQTLEVDPDLADIEVALPPPYVNDSWPQPGGYATHAMHHLQIPADIKEVWRVKAGQGSQGGVRLTAPPVVGDGTVFVRDAVASVSAFDAVSGKRLWEVNLKPRKTKSYMGTGGGVAFAEGKVFASTGFGFIVALDGKTGTEIWRQSLGLAIRSAPTVSNGRLFVSTFDNQLFALSTTDGRIFWNHRATPETARLLVSSSPAVSGDIVIAPFSSGEIFALRVQNGRVAWSDALQRTGQLTPLATLNDIAGRPVIDRGRVIAVSHNGRMVSIDLRSGERVWTRDIGSVQTPWVAGDYIYVVSIDSEIICLSRRDGRIRWITLLQQFENEKKKKGPIFWSGPVLAGDRLIVVSSHGEALSVSPYTGEILGHIDLPHGSFISPIVANETVFLLTDDAKLIALR
ncbi:MAG: pyrrolo-quinoline quinone [Alphaproteobacteria bacterium]|nr:MAG: pyrrolo-quinoline quinone [Alphaproteobacteria bacterium]